MAEAYNHFSQIAEALQEAAGQLVRKTAKDIQAGAQVRAPVDTGALKNSIHTEDGSNDFEQLVVVSVDYAAYQEFGTYKMPAHPYLIPAVEAAKPSFEAAIKDLFNYASRLE